MPLTIVRLTGGLGNQMFQYAFGLEHSRRHETCFLLDRNWLVDYPVAKGFTKRSNELEVFNLSPSYMSIVRWPITLFGGRVGYKVAFRIAKRRSGFNVTTVSLGETPTRALGLNGPRYFIGDFQNARYFSVVSDEIANLFSTRLSGNEASLESEMEKCNSVSIHVRRGDYLSLQHTGTHSLCDLRYYRTAMDLIEKRIETPTYFVFSDDLEWCRVNIRSEFPVRFIEGNSGENAYLDMQLMSRCKCNIIANSTFSWWSAWLNKHPGKLVICPKKWFVSGSENEKNALRQDSWVSI